MGKEQSATLGAEAGGMGEALSEGSGERRLSGDIEEWKRVSDNMEVLEGMGERPGRAGGAEGTARD